MRSGHSGQTELELRQVDLLSHWRCHTGELHLAYVGTHPTSVAQNKQGSSLKSYFLHWAQTSVCFVPKDPLVAKRQTAHASNPSNRRKETLRLGDSHLQGYRNLPQRISVCFEVSVFLNQEAFFGGGIIPVASSKNSSTSPSSSSASPWSDSTSKDPKSMVPDGTFCDVSEPSSSQLPTPSRSGANFGGPPLI